MRAQRTLSRHAAASVLALPRGRDYHHHHHHQQHTKPAAAYHPLHRFRLEEEWVAESPEAFRKMVTNPGPIKVTFSNDYFDWYYRAYKERVKNHRAAVAKAGADGEGEGLRTLPGSALRQRGERMQRDAQRRIDDLSVQHGMLDLWERQPQYAFIDISRAEPFHIRSILETFLETSFSNEALWYKALLYRAVMLHNAKHYPNDDGFGTALKWANGAAIGAAPGAPVDGDAPPAPAATDVPTQDWQDYFVKLVQKLQIHNAVEAHIVLQLLDHPDAAQLLRIEPVPEKGELSPDDFVKPETPLPPIHSLFDDNNFDLARVLVFAEWNCWVTQGDFANPFEKFVAARDHITRPVVTPPKTSTAFFQALDERRTGYVALNERQRNKLEARCRDIRAYFDRTERADGAFVKELAKLADENPALYQYERSFYNPKTKKAQYRDVLDRGIAKSLDQYERGDNLTRRPTVDAVEQDARFPPREALPVATPTVPWFTRILRDDPHVSLALAMAPSPEALHRLKLRVHTVAEQLFKMSTEYHKPELRRAHYQKTQIAMTLLDEDVANVLSNQDAQDALDAMQLGAAVPWAGRAIDRLGLPSEARMDDYRRWMTNPAVMSK